MSTTQKGSAVKRSPESKKLVVIYCQGGTKRCRWVATEPRHDDQVGAMAFAEDLNRRGYKTKVKTVHEMEIIGLPIGWDSSTNVADWELRPDGFHWHSPKTEQEVPL